MTLTLKTNKFINKFCKYRLEGYKLIKKDNIMERVPTGIKILDDGMSGGLVRNSINMIAGGPGSGKSIFAMQYLINGATKYDEPGIYI